MTKSHATLYRSTLFVLNRYLVNGIFDRYHFLKLLDNEHVPIEVIFDLLVVGKNFNGDTGQKSYFENVSHFASFAKVKKFFSRFNIIHIVSVKILIEKMLHSGDLSETKYLIPLTSKSVQGRSARSFPRAF